jgi:Ribosomal protein L4
MSMVPVYGLDGSEKSQMVLPKIFSLPYRPDVIHRVYVAMWTHKLQPKAVTPWPVSGLQHNHGKLGMVLLEFHALKEKGTVEQYGCWRCWRR